MMTTLNTIEITSVPAWCAYPIVVGFVCLAIALILCCVRLELLYTVTTFTVIGIVCGVFGLIAAIAAPEVPTGKFQIEATFTKDFPFVSVMEQYNVIEQRGDIFLLEPKGDIG